MKKINRFLTIHQTDTAYTFLPTGDIFTFLHKGFLINQFRGNALDGSVNNIYLRIYKDNTISSYPLLGVRSQSRVFASEKHLVYEGTADSIHYQVEFRPVNNIWFWNVTLEGKGTVDLVYGQDLGIGEEGSIYTNELYISQYLGHSVFSGENGYVICSRQNMPCGGTFPYIQQGVLGAKAEHFSTDGLQFFGLSCRESNIPESLSDSLEDKNLQYEFAYTALQTEKIFLEGSKTVSFYGIFLENHEQAVTEIEFQQELQAAYDTLSEAVPAPKPVKGLHKTNLFGNPYSSFDFTKEEINRLFPVRNLEEVSEECLCSFFTPDHAHVVTKAKELVCDRPHGTIIITPPDTEAVNSKLIASTQYMNGVFNSHVVIGNTDMHKLLSTPRGFLNLLKNSGQRLYVRLDGVYRLLSLPGLFEMGMNYSKWYYKLPEDVLTVTAFAAASSPDLVLQVSSLSGSSYDYIITNQLSAGPNEHVKDIRCSQIPHGLRFFLETPAYPGLHYDFILPEKEFLVSDDRIFFAEACPEDETFLTLSLTEESEFSLIIRGSLDESQESLQAEYSFEKEKADCMNYYETLTGHFHLDMAVPNEKTAILNETIWWYAHNAMIHFSMPHGLEQPGGAAWGTRDICQGPFEFFLTTQHYGLLRSILLNIFSHQNYETREWPQWFMFDRYSMNPGECHGDVIFWPLKCVGDYMNASGDTEILKEILPYDEAPEKTETLLEHIKRALANIKETRFLADSGLITYAGGDWDDTLQPANGELKQSLVSAWTEALAYQTFHTLACAVKEAEHTLSEELFSLSELVKSAFLQVLIKDKVIAGFLENKEEYNYLLHPADNKTGIHYRLLPMTRSIIAELVDKEQAAANVTAIREHLKCPDGIRLMDKPASYDGGISHLFKRAEQAANVGREISLQYTHAHIRYIEAMAKLGDAREAWDALFVINPVLIQHSVPNARIRQSNMYFSSSEGAYNDRYDYAKNFHLLKTGDIQVKGGWRLYSSGPGIYLKQLIANVLGIRFQGDGLVIDPVLPAELDGLTFSFDCYGRTFHFRYCMTDDGVLRAEDEKGCIDADILSNPYRSGGLFIKKEILEDCSDSLNIYIGR